MSEFVCVLCPPGRPPRAPQFPPVCQACRLWLAHVLADLSVLAEELAADPDLVPDARLAPVPQPGKAANERGPLVFDVSRQAWLRPAMRDGAGRIAVRRRDPVAALLPSGSAGRRVSAPTSGSREPAIPINVDAVDILAEARPASRRLMARGALGLDGDQIGHLSLATALDAWVRDWRARRRAGEGLPPATVYQMLQWLADRCAWGCDHHPDIASFAAELADYRVTIRGLLGLVDVPDWRKGVACRQCGAFALYRRVGGPADGRLMVECAACPALLEWQDYLAWVRDGAATVCPDCGHLPDLHRPETVKPPRLAGCRMCACRLLPAEIADRMATHRARAA